MATTGNKAKINSARRRSPPRRILLSTAVGLLATVVVSWGRAFDNAPLTSVFCVGWTALGTPGGSDASGKQFVACHKTHWFRSQQAIDVYRTPYFAGSVSELHPSYRLEWAPEWSSVRRLEGRVPLPPQDGPDAGFSEFATGWPMPALMGKVRFPWKPSGRGGPGRVDVGIPLPAFPATIVGNWYAQWGALPTRPLWPGFVVDVALWAAMWFLGGLAISGWRARRNRLRIRQLALDGRCTNCGYDRAGLITKKQGGEVGNACPECGAIFAAPPTIQVRSATTSVKWPPSHRPETSEGRTNGDIHETDVSK